MKPDLVSGSPLWQTIFVSFAVVLMLFQIARGWQLGLPRQLVRMGALVAAYSTAWFGGQALLPLLRPLIKVPDFIISAIGGMILAMIVYSVINTLGAILFKRTGQQQSSIVRLVYGATGALLGVVFGLFFVWLLVVGIRSLGAVAEAQINARAPSRIPRFDERAGSGSPARSRSIRAHAPEQDSIAMSLARLKKSVELGSVGEVVKQTDALPGGAETLGKVGQVFARPERAQRFLSYPGIAELADSPKILALRADPEITAMIEQGKLWQLMQDDRLIEAANDPELARQLKTIDFKAALDHALRD
ncbi:MAG: CvpA family protein [Chthoniobacterales bacterium]|nr:CvpA family protein [Chthoniobacterales bacterium]